MPEQSRLGDDSNVPSDSHGCSGCAHNCTGPAISGSGNVNVNGKPALRGKGTDNGVHSGCCGPNSWVTNAGSGTVFINGQPAVRKNDATIHCGGTGKMTQGSGNVFTGG